MKYLVTLLSIILFFGAVPSANASDNNMANMEEIKKKKDEEKEEEQRKLEAGYAPLPVDQR